MKKALILLLLCVFLSTGSSFAASLSGVVNINTATQAELEVLPGIGEAKAQAIIAQRQQKPFAKKEELLLIKGIGDKIFAKLAPYVAITGNTTLKSE